MDIEIRKDPGEYTFDNQESLAIAPNLPGLSLAILLTDSDDLSGVPVDGGLYRIPLTPAVDNRIIRLADLLAEIHFALIG